MDLSTGEMAHMFYSTLGNLAYYNTSGVYPQLGWGLTNVGPFTNIQNVGDYWYGTEYAPDSSYKSWRFSFVFGGQTAGEKHLDHFAWAVASGDPLATPLPAAFWLFGGALGALGWVRRRQAKA